MNLDQVYRHRDMAQQTMTQQQAVATVTTLILITQLDLRDMETIPKLLLIHQGMFFARKNKWACKLRLECYF